MPNWLSVRKVRNEDVSATDAIIVLIGPTGSGKSSFVEKATGIHGLVGDGLESSTQELSVFRFTLPGDDNSSICLVDTPGFDNTNRADYEVFKMISKWLIETYSKQIGLAGLLYFHRISDNRMSGRPLNNLHYFRQLCENELDRVILTTTMWDEVDEKTGTNREDVLQTDFWKPLIDHGSSVKRFLNDTASAFDILRPIVQGASIQRNAPEHTVDHVSAIKQSLLEQAITVIERLRQKAVRVMATRWKRRIQDRAQRATEIATDWTSPPKIIVFAGPYCCGKSRFIDCLTQNTAWANSGLQPSDHPVRSVEVRVHNGNGSVVLVDTPGFDGFKRTAEDILEDTCDWLKKNYRNSKVAGLVYLQNILDNRLTTSPPISILKKMREDDIISNLVFVTTHWDRVELNQGIARERQFCRALEPLLAWGARRDRFDNETKTAWRILDALLSQTT